MRTYIDKPDAPSNVSVPEIDITSGTFVVQWDEVTDIFHFNYNVSWYGEDGNNGTATVTGLSYTVMWLTANTSYNVTVVAINTCCGAGPVSDVVMAMTNMRPTTPPTTPTTSTQSTTTGNNTITCLTVLTCDKNN